MRGMALMLLSSGRRVGVRYCNVPIMEVTAVSFRAAFERTQRLSRYAQRVAAARPAVVDELEARADRPWQRAEMRAALAGDPEGLAARLRSLRERVMLALAHRDLNGLASLDEVFATMTALADTKTLA